MGKIKGIKIILIGKIETGKDPFGKPIEEDVEIEIDDVLVAPVTSDDITSRTNLEGKKAVYKLGIPKGDSNDWVDKEVRFFGKRWRTIGIPLEGIEDLMPLRWNKQIMVEYYE